MKFSSCIKSFMFIEAINHSIGTYKLKLISLFAYLLAFEPRIWLCMSTLVLDLNALFS